MREIVRTWYMAVSGIRRVPADRRRPAVGASEYGLARTVLRFAIALRCGGVAAACGASLLGDAPGVSGGWQAAVLCGLVAWAAFFTAVAVRRGLWAPLIMGDTAVVSLVMLLQSRLVPVSSVIDETTWAVMLASTAIYVSQLALRPFFGLSLAAVVIAAYLIGVPLVTSQIRVLFVQAVVVSAMMALLRRGGRDADAIVADRDRDRHRARVEAARRADERLYRAQMHDSVLATLTMVASGAVRTGSPALRAVAREALEVMETYASPPPAADGPLIDVVERLAPLVTRLCPELSVDLDVAGWNGSGEPALAMPEPVADAIVDATREALRNVAAHAGTREASVHLERSGDSVRVHVVDQGRGFDPDHVPSARHGIRHSIVERMAMVGGTATVRSGPGTGTAVTLRWTRG